jgi:hypothetical protein
MPAVEVRDEKIVPRYVQAHALRQHGMGPRNLFWGVVLLFIALAMLVVAVFLVGAKAMIYVATCLVTFTALFVLTRMHIFRQRNGGFLALGLVCLLGAAIPLVESAYTAVKGLVGVRNGGLSPVAALRSDESDAPLLTQSFALAKPQGDGKQVKVTRDSHVVIGDKTFLIKAGDRFPLLAQEGDQTAFAVRDLRLSLPANVTEIVDPTAVAAAAVKPAGAAPAATVSATAGAASSAPAPVAASKTGAKATDEDSSLAELTRSAQQEAMRMYPALAIKDSLENAMFVSTYKQLRDAGSEEFFANPEWPLELARLLADREGWNRGGRPVTTGPAPVLDPPADEPPAARPQFPPANLPPVNTLDAGSDLPRSR